MNLLKLMMAIAGLNLSTVALAETTDKWSPKGELIKGQVFGKVFVEAVDSEISDKTPKALFVVERSGTYYIGEGVFRLKDGSCYHFSSSTKVDKIAGTGAPAFVRPSYSTKPTSCDA